LNSQSAQITEYLAGLLTHVPAIMMPDGLDAILTMVRARGCDLSTPTGGNMQIVCYQLITAAAVRPGALQYLASAVRRLDGTRLGDSFADEVARQLPSDFFALADRLKFVEEIAKLIRPDETYMYYERVAGSACLVPLPDADTLVRELEELIADDMPSHPLVLLTEEIAIQVRKRSLRKTASELSDQLASQIDSCAGQERGGERSRLAELRKENRRTCRTACDVERATLTLMLEPYVPRQDAGYRLQIWLYRGDQQPEQRRAIDAPLTLSEIEREVIDQIDLVVRELSRPKAVANVDLEFILPRSMLGYPVEDWVIMGRDHITLGTQFQVVVRDGDRLHHPILWTPWQEKWRRVPSVKLTSDVVFSRWLTCLDAPSGAGELYRELLNKEYVSFGLTFPPELEAGRLELHDVLDAGVPVAVWPRGRCTHPIPARPADPCAGTEFKKNLCREMAGKPLRNMPELVREARRSGAVGVSGLALLWDDADRTPPYMLFDAPYYRRPDE
jgi:vWA-MoxR associated protein C-terminal domain